MYLAIAFELISHFYLFALGFNTTFKLPIVSLSLYTIQDIQTKVMHLSIPSELSSHFYLLVLGSKTTF